MTRFDPAVSLANMRHEFGEHGGVNMSIEASTTFTVMHASTMPEIFRGRRGPESGGCFLYGRHFNPTVYVLGREIAAIEGAEAGYATSSGLGAISAALLQICNHGDHIVAGNTIYGGTFALLNDYLPVKAGITTTFVPAHDVDAVARAITPKTRAIYRRVREQPDLAHRRHSSPRGGGEVAGRAPGRGQHIHTDDSQSDRPRGGRGRAFVDEVHEWSERHYRRAPSWGRRRSSPV